MTTMVYHNKYIPYGRQNIDQTDIDAVLAALKSNWLTTGPLVKKFEEMMAAFTGASHAIAVNSGTAALHAAMNVIGISADDEVLVPAITFAATANCVIYQGGTPVFVDVMPDNLLIDPDDLEKKITNRTKAIITVDYAGHPCNYDKIRKITDKYGLWLIADSCHALGAEYRGRKLGAIADLTVFSFHPVKPITTGEGGMVLTENRKIADKIRRFRNHGINTDHHQRRQQGKWHYEITELGFNYRISDLQCAIGISQLKKLPAWQKHRDKLARMYNKQLAGLSEVFPLQVDSNIIHSWHLYVVKIANQELRNFIFNYMRQQRIGVNVHYMPVYLHPFYQKKFNTTFGVCSQAEDLYNKIITLPLHTLMSENDVELITVILREAVSHWYKEEKTQLLRNHEAPR